MADQSEEMGMALYAEYWEEMGDMHRPPPTWAALSEKERWAWRRAAGRRSEPMLVSAALRHKLTRLAYESLRSGRLVLPYLYLRLLNMVPDMRNDDIPF